MSSPIKVRGRFATTRDTAETLGVSQARAKQLIATAKELTSRIAEGLVWVCPSAVLTLVTCFGVGGTITRQRAASASP